jgi:PIN domain nuclease of toxin-antitoxin system
MHGDPADRLIAATAKSLHLPLITADRRIRDLANYDSIW